jgi:hypothetical protein
MMGNDGLDLPQGCITGATKMMAKFTVSELALSPSTVTDREWFLANRCCTMKLPGKRVPFRDCVFLAVHEPETMHCFAEVESTAT